MDKLKSFSHKSAGTLFVVATPIGNLGDISKRSQDILSTSDLILCEDTRVTKKLLSKLSIDRKISVYNDHSSSRDRESIVNQLQNGLNIAIVSDAGTPLISDPGFKLVELCREKDINVDPIPGPCALITALSAAGLPSDTFFFGGFFPRTSEKASELLISLIKLQTTAIFYESPTRIVKTLELIQKSVNDVKICLAREVTKLYQEFITDKISNVIDQLKKRERVKGEIVIILDLRVNNNCTDAVIIQLLRELMDENSIKDSVSIASQKLSLPKKRIYDIALDIKKI